MERVDETGERQEEKERGNKGNENDDRDKRHELDSCHSLITCAVHWHECTSAGARLRMLSTTGDSLLVNRLQQPRKSKCNC